jgi:uncharacterized metal-binding protein YceD (DUF177 family)
MSKFQLYNVPLKDITEVGATFDYDLNNEFFKKIDSPEVERGNVKATVAAKKKTATFELKIELSGSVTLPCNRCLDDMQQPITHKETLLVKFGEGFSEEGEIVIVPEADGKINLAWFFYEMIVLNIPIKHVHAPGECNKAMEAKLKKHTVKHTNDYEEDTDLADFDTDFDDTPTDARWDKLNELTYN